MEIQVLNNPNTRHTNSYLNLFHVAQHNLTLWLLEENDCRIKKKQKRLAKFQKYNRAPNVSG